MKIHLVFTVQFRVVQFLQILLLSLQCCFRIIINTFILSTFLASYFKYLILMSTLLNCIMYHARTIKLNLC